jgi:arsenate reductase-like glutaredoxin family protein
MTRSKLSDLLGKLAGTRKTQKKRESVLTRLKKQATTTEKRAMEASALVAASRRIDYTRLVRERAKISEFLEKATTDYKAIEERMKNIEKDELSKLVSQAQKPKMGLFW